MIDPVFWLVLSFVLVSVSLTAVLVVMVPAVRELSRAARSVEKLCDTLNKDLPPTLESIRLTSAEINQLTDDMNAGVKNAGRVAERVDHSVSTARVQAKRATISTRSFMAGIGAAWHTLTQPEPNRPRSRRSGSASMERSQVSIAVPSPPPVSHGDRTSEPLPSPSAPTSSTKDLPASPPPVGKDNAAKRLASDVSDASADGQRSTETP